MPLWKLLQLAREMLAAWKGLEPHDQDRAPDQATRVRQLTSELVRLTSRRSASPDDSVDAEQAVLAALKADGDLVPADAAVDVGGARDRVVVMRERWKHLAGPRGKHTGTVAVACARELASFCWEAATLN